MALNITQYPASASLAQSPMAFTVFEDTAVVLSSSFQYYADLYYWTGSESAKPAADIALGSLSNLNSNLLV